MTIEVKHVFRLVLLGCLTLALFASIGVSINYYQQRAIKNTQDSLKRNTLVLLKRDCTLVVSTAHVFTDFIKKEIALRIIRAHDPQASKPVREFDAAEVTYWLQHTLPALNRVYLAHCSGITR
jgi:hypothetical protein